MRSFFVLGCAAQLVAANTAYAAGFKDRAGLEQSLQTIAKDAGGRVGICAQDAENEPVCVRGDERFPLQSVMKLIVAAAAMDAFDRHELQLTEPVVVHKENLGIGFQPIAEMVEKSGGAYHTTLADLLHRSVTESDNGAADILLDRIGGVKAVAQFLQSKNIDGMRVDRDERRLQTETAGFTWKAEYVDAAKLKAAEQQVADSVRTAAFTASLADPRDTSTPAAMVRFLRRLAAGKLLSPSSTENLLKVMAAASTGVNRLPAGTPKGWKLGHKTGTSGVWHGLAAATNDVGLWTAPDGKQVAVAVFVAESRRREQGREAVIAQAAKAITAAYARHP